MFTHKKLFCFISGFTLSQLSYVSIAQETSEDSENDDIELITVTAQKREQTFIEVPMAVEAIGGTELLQRGINSVQDLSFAVPGLTTREDGPGSYQIFMRGVANTDGGFSLVSVYQDEAPLTLTGVDQLPTKVFDINRVEVLKGPQGTLYGQGAVTGTIRYITNQPDLMETSGNVNLELRSVSEGDTGYILNGMVNVPIIEDELAIRMVGAVSDGGGWQDQPEAGIEDGNDEELEYLRVKALWTPNDELEIEASVVSYFAEYQLGLGYEQPDRTIFVAIDPARELVPKIWDYEQYGLTINYAFDNFDLVSATSFAEMDHQYPFSYFGSEQTIYGGFLSGNDDRTNDGKQFSQEIRLSSSTDSPLTWTVGAFYRDLERDIEAFFETQFFDDVFEDLYFYRINDSESYAFFADTSYQVTDELLLGIGIRYFDDKQTQRQGEVGNPVQEGEFDSFDPRFYANYSLSDNVNLYANVAKGFRSGGFNGFDGATGEELPDFDPESLWSYELGVKGYVNDFIFDIAAYYTDYEDMLRRGLVFISGELGFQSLLSNIGQVEVRGIEGSVTWRATDDLSLDFSAALIDSEVVEVNADDATNIVGDPVDYVPDLSYTLGAYYQFNWSDNMPGFVRVNYSYRDKLPFVDRTSFPAGNLPQFSDDISLLDARIGLTYEDLSIEVFGTNLTDENKLIDPYWGWNNANRTRPRTVGINIGYQF